MNSLELRELKETFYSDYRVCIFAVSLYLNIIRVIKSTIKKKKIIPMLENTIIFIHVLL